jgi:hypothetical protein
LELCLNGEEEKKHVKKMRRLAGATPNANGHADKNGHF